MKRLIVASENPVKLRAAHDGFAAMFPGQAVEVRGLPDVPSGVPDQPMSDAETLRGATNRADAARNRHPAADFWLGMEGGVDARDGTLEAFAWIVILSKDGRVGRSRTATFDLPPAVAQLVRDGVELGHAMDRVCAQHNTKQKGGAVGLLTNGAITRATYYAHAVTLALIAFATPLPE